jgi:hypothetical protein
VGADTEILMFRSRGLRMRRVCMREDLAPSPTSDPGRSFGGLGGSHLFVVAGSGSNVTFVTCHSPPHGLKAGLVEAAARARASRRDAAMTSEP